MNKTLDVVDSQDLINKVDDVKIVGDPDTWQLICKASSKSQGWMKSTKAMEIDGLGCLIQVTTQQGDNVAESVVYVPDVVVKTKEDGSKYLADKYRNTAKLADMDKRYKRLNLFEDDETPKKSPYEDKLVNNYL